MTNALPEPGQAPCEKGAQSLAFMKRESSTSHSLFGGHGNYCEKDIPSLYECHPDDETTQ